MQHLAISRMSVRSLLAVAVFEEVLATALEELDAFVPGTSPVEDAAASGRVPLL